MVEIERGVVAGRVEPAATTRLAALNLKDSSRSNHEGDP